MTRRLAVFAWVVLVLIAVVAIVAFAPFTAQLRSRIVLDTANEPSASTASPPAMQGMPGGAPTEAIARGEVTIDSARQQLTGVRTEGARRERVGAEIRAVGIVRYDETRQADINTKIDGWIRELYADYTGRAVRAGEPLFTLYSPELLTTENEYLLARRSHDRAAQSEIEDVRQYSDRLLAAARERLLLWDVPDTHIQELEQRAVATGVVTFRSPLGGVLVEKTAVKGMRVMAGQTLFRVADVSTVWVEADVYERDLASLRVGQTAEVTLDAYPGESFAGRASYIYPALNEATRAARVRFALANQGGRLRPGMYANLEIAGANREGITVPVNAVLDSGTEQTVFVAQGEGRFSPRTVRVGFRGRDRLEILEGIAEGEQVAVGATFFLDSESQLRAGLQNYETSGPGQGGASAAASTLDITFRTRPDRPSTGENTFEVVVKDAEGRPLIDADVSVQLFMPAMPTMNMPAMRNETKLPHVSGGLYRGPGQVMMAGRWDVTVTVAKSGKQLGRKQLALAAR